MRQCTLALLAVAAICSAVALAGNARAGKTTAAPSRRPAPATPATSACQLPAGYRAAFEAAARTTGLPLPLLVAVGEVESRLQQGARSGAGAQGVLQVLPSTADAFGLDPARPRTNVLAGARYLRQLLDRFDSADLALAAYNAGPSAVERYGGAPSAETLTYVANVTERWRSLRSCG
jgi:soluble lytic murein transglycosylase-like protein